MDQGGSGDEAIQEGARLGKENDAHDSCRCCAGERTVVGYIRRAHVETRQRASFKKMMTGH